MKIWNKPSGPESAPIYCTQTFPILIWWPLPPPMGTSNQCIDSLDLNSNTITWKKFLQHHTTLVVLLLVTKKKPLPHFSTLFHIILPHFFLMLRSMSLSVLKKSWHSSSVFWKMWVWQLLMKCIKLHTHYSLWFFVSLLSSSVLFFKQLTFLMMIPDLSENQEDASLNEIHAIWLNLNNNITIVTNLFNQLAS